MKNYMDMFNKAMDIVHDLGIETGNIVDVKLNYRAKNRFGQCRKNNVLNTKAVIPTLSLPITVTIAFIVVLPFLMSVHLASIQTRPENAP